MRNSVSNRKILSTKITFMVPKDSFKKIAQVNTPPKNQGVPLLSSRKNGFTPRQVTRFLRTEKSDNSPDSVDVLDGRSALMR